MFKHFDDLKEINCPFGELDADTIGRFVRAWMDGDMVEVKSTAGWNPTYDPQWWKEQQYRLAPKPLTKPSVDWSHVGEKWNWMATDG